MCVTWFLFLVCPVPYMWCRTYIYYHIKMVFYFHSDFIKMLLSLMKGEKNLPGCSMSCIYIVVYYMWCRPLHKEYDYQPISRNELYHEYYHSTSTSGLFISRNKITLILILVMISVVAVWCCLWSGCYSFTTPSNNLNTSYYDSNIIIKY